MTKPTQSTLNKLTSSVFKGGLEKKMKRIACFLIGHEWSYKTPEKSNVVYKLCGRCGLRDIGCPICRAYYGHADDCLFETYV